MSTFLRVILIVVSIFALIYTISKIRRSKAHINDTVFWIAVAVFMLLLSIFPEINSFLAMKLGFQSPENLLYLLAIGILGIKVFLMSLSISALQDKITILSQKTAIDEFEEKLKK